MKIFALCALLWVIGLMATVRYADEIDAMFERVEGYFHE